MHTIAEKIVDKGSVIHKQSKPVKIFHKKGRIESVIVKSEGKKLKFKNKNIVSTIPITTFLKLLDPKPPERVLKCANN